jgi:hypothetical protein
LTVAAGTASGQARQQHRHAGHVPVVLARLIGAAQHHLVDMVAEAGMALQEGAQRQGREIVGPDPGERAPKSADGRAHGIADENRSLAGHGVLRVSCLTRLGPANGARQVRTGPSGNGE